MRQREWSFARTITTTPGSGHKKQTLVEYLFVPLPKQVDFLASKAAYKLYGGSAGPGKSHTIRWGLYRLSRVIPNFRALLLRESYEELEQTHFADMEVEQELIGGRFIKGDHMMVWDDNKSRIIGGHMQDPRAIKRYLSTNYDVIACDEGSQYPPQSLMELSTRARTTKSAAKPYVGDGQFWVASNPGGPSTNMLEEFFISHTPNFEDAPQLAKEYKPEEWEFIRALLDDNPYSAESYSRKLAVLPSWRYQQLRHGDWSAAEGAFFEDFAKHTHTRTVGLPRPLTGAVEAVDWGFTAPGCVGWFAPVGDNHWHCIKEWKFKRQTAEDVARGIVKIRKELGIKRVRYTVCDPSMYNKTGHAKGESFADTFARFGVPCRRGDNDRAMGWPRLAAWFRPASDGIPWLTFDPDCKYLIRTLPALLADRNDPEDVDSSLDDHGADMCRYFVMSRPPLSQNPTDRPAELIPGSWGWWRRYHNQQSEPKGVLA